MTIWSWLCRWRRSHDDLDEEIRVHLEMAIRDRIAQGQSPSEAERQSRTEFGNPLLIKEVTRDIWGWTAWDNLGQDLRYALRQVRRSPGFCAVATVTLAFGIGVNTIMFSLVNAILFQPMHARNPEQIVAVFSSINRDAPYGSSSYPDYLDIRDRSVDVFQDLIGIGVPASVAVSLLISKFLFGVAALDPETYVAVPSLMAIVALAAIAIPAARSMRIEPLRALRAS